jgi:hypothetical protein
MPLVAISCMICGVKTYWDSWPMNWLSSTATAATITAACVEDTMALLE